MITLEFELGTGLVPRSYSRPKKDITNLKIYVRPDLHPRICQSRQNRCVQGLQEVQIKDKNIKIDFTFLLPVF